MTTQIETLTPTNSETPTASPTDTMSDNPMSGVSDVSDAAPMMSDMSDTATKTSHDNVIGVALPIVAAVVLNLIGAINLYSAFAASGLGDLGTAVPVLLCGGLELGIAACAFMAHRLRSNDRASASANALTWVLSAVSAYIGYNHAVHLGWEPAVVGVVVGAPIAAATVWHIHLRTNFALAHGRARQDEANETLVRRAAAARMDSDRAARKYARIKLVVWLADVRAYRAERAVTLGATVSEIAPLAARYEMAVVRLDAALNRISTATSCVSDPHPNGRPTPRPAEALTDTDTPMSDVSDSTPDALTTSSVASDTSTDTIDDSATSGTERPHLSAVTSTTAVADDSNLSDLIPTVSDMTDTAPEPVATPDIDAADNTDTKELQAAKLLEKGRAVGEVAAKFHVSERTIHRWRKKVAEQQTATRRAA